MPTAETGTGNAQLDALLSVMRQEVPTEAKARGELFASVRKKIEELQSQITRLTAPQAKRLHEAIAAYEAQTKSVHAEIHTDLSTLRQAVTKAHPALTPTTAPGAPPPPAAAPEQPQTLEQYINTVYPAANERTGFNWSMRYIWYAFYRLSFGVGKFFRRGQPGQTTNQPQGEAKEKVAQENTPIDIERLPLVGGQPQNLLQFANRNQLQLGSSRMKILREGTGTSDRYLFEVGSKRYALMLEDYPHEGAAAVTPLDIGRELVAQATPTAIETRTMAIRYASDNVMLVGEAHLFGSLMGGGRTSIPKATFQTMLQEVLAKQATQTTIEFADVAVRYTGKVQTGPGTPPSAPTRNATNEERKVPKIKFVEVARP